MADEGIKKAIIKKSSLPPVNGNNQSYILRYRIITEDRNRSSHWSPRYTLLTQAITPVSENQRSVSITGSGTTKTVTIVWVPPTNLSITNFDIYVKVGSGQYEYKTTVSTPTYATIASSGSQVSIAVQVPTYPKNRFSSATLFEEINIEV